MNSLKTENRFVLPIPGWLRVIFIEKSRLYAYPTTPEPPYENGFIILDSGAFGLSMRGGKMTHAYMENLNEYYSCNGAAIAHNVIAIAPDEFLNPKETMSNFKWWVLKGYCKVSPVLQCTKKGEIDLVSILKQIEFYKAFDIDFKFIAFSNPSLRSMQVNSLEIKKMIDIIRQNFKGVWVHNLGAGWNQLDAQKWLELGFDSIDSISYYTDAASKKMWRNGNDTMPTIYATRKETANHNQKMANL
jgi:hypothetical protein